MLQKNIPLPGLENIILFDGICNLCDHSVQFIIKKDKKGVFKFASLQSEIATRLAKGHQLELNSLNSMVLFKSSCIYTKSTAWIMILEQLEYFGWAKIFRIVPQLWRDKGYDFVAANRYRFFGIKDKCSVPDPQILKRFI